MIDDNDVDFAILATTSSSGGCGWSILGLILIAALAIAASMNSNECGKQTCPPGTSPRLLDHACLCVAEARP